MNRIQSTRIWMMQSWIRYVLVYGLIFGFFLGFWLWFSWWLAARLLPNWGLKTNIDLIRLAAISVVAGLTWAGAMWLLVVRRQRHLS
jgi:hypothetical protein